MKKIISILAMMTVLFTSAPVMAAGTLSDVSSYKYKEAVLDLFAEGDISGYSDGTFRPGNTVNRAEFLKILLTAKGETLTGSKCYPDVQTQWFAPAVCRAKELGIVSGYADGLFHPEKTINFAEAAKMLVETYDLTQVDAELSSGFWFTSYIKTLEGQKSIPVEMDSFSKNITRGQAVEMIWRLNKKIITKTTNTYENIRNGYSAEEGVVCTADYSPVCGADGKTYSNKCKATTAGTTVAAEGECVAKNTGDYKLEKFDSCSALEAETGSGNGYYPGGFITPMDSPASLSEATGNDGAKSESSLSDSTGDYSQTNVQVEGVDEADIVKTDGDYIYLVKGDEIKVVQVDEYGSMKEKTALDFDDDSFTPQELYVSDGILVVVGNSYAEIDSKKDLDDADEVFSFADFSAGITVAYVFDASTPTDLDLVREVAIEGGYLTSRRIDDVLYLVTNEYSYYRWWKEGDTTTEQNEYNLVPLFRDSANDDKYSPVCNCDDIYFVPNTGASSKMVVAGIPLSAKGEIGTSVIAGSWGTVYASTENLYVANTFYPVSSAGGTTAQTAIYKFALDDGEVSLTAQGTVPGTVLNQFSMDEYEKHLRIATTEQSSSNGLSNNLYVLDKNLKQTGEIEDIADGERIYSVRFMGERGYMVTFKQTDPLFAIDLSDPKDPEIMGELKIPGFSNYLHPIGENYLLGVGFDAPDPDVVEDLDWVWYQGMKLALFDITNIKKPKQLYTEIIGDRGTYSPATYNHKAFFYDAERELLILPVQVAEIDSSLKKESTKSSSWVYGDTVFQGAYVYHLGTDDGFKLLGKLSHYSTDFFEQVEGSWWGGGARDISRVLRVGEYLYTISEKIFTSWSLPSLVKKTTLEVSN